MAVGQDFVLEDEDDEQVEMGAADGGAEEEEADNYAANNAEIKSIDDDADKESAVVINGPQRLSHEALKLLMRASRCVMKRSSPIKQRSTRIRGRLRQSSRSGAAAAAAKDVDESLLEELQSLRDLIPSTRAFGDIDVQPCVIRDALGYLKSLKQEIKSLNQDLVKTVMNSVASDAKVEINNNMNNLEIHVSCCKKTGLLAEIMLALESLGLIFDEVNISCSHRLLLQASSTQEGIHLMDDKEIKKAIWTTLCRY